MTEAQRRDPPEPSALIQRLLRRRTEPIGIIDVRHAQTHYARIAGWIEARFPLLAELAVRHGLSGEDEAGAAEFIYAGRIVLRPQDQAICVPGTAAVQRSGPRLSQPSQSIPSPFQGEGEGMAPSTPLPQGKGELKTKIQGNTYPPSGGKEALDATPVQPPLSPAAERFKVSSFARGRVRGGEDHRPSITPSSLLPLGKGKGGKTASYAQCLPQSASLGEDKDEAVPFSPASPEVKPTKTVWRVRRAAPGSMTVLSPEFTHSPGQALDPPRFPPTKPIEARIQRKHSDVSLPLPKGEAQGGGRETPTSFDPLPVSPFVSFVRGRFNELYLPQSASIKGKGAVDGIASVAASSSPLAPEAPVDMHAVPLVLRRTSTSRALETEDSREQRRTLPSNTSPQGPLEKSSHSGITKHPPVSQTIVPIPERPRLRLSKREWSQLIERLSRLIWHKLAIDLDRRGVRSWR